jgi:hypothetical protein
MYAAAARRMTSTTAVRSISAIASRASASSPGKTTVGHEHRAVVERPGKHLVEDRGSRQGCAPSEGDPEFDARYADGTMGTPAATLPVRAVLDAFGASGEPISRQGGQGTAVRAGHLVLKPVRLAGR